MNSTDLEKAFMGRYRKDSPPDPAWRQNDDQMLWEKVTQSVKRMSHRNAIQPLKKKGNPETGSKTEGHMQALTSIPQELVKAKPKPFETNPADFRLGQTSGIDKSSARRLQRGRINIEGRLDLHGMSREQAHEQLNTFISQALKENYRYLLIITGKGRDGHGILRQQVPVWLKNEPLCRHINAISYAQPKDGGTGALYIRLKRQRGDVK
jgi:DNA-nicking Smr family endonuclease